MAEALNIRRGALLGAVLALAGTYVSTVMLFPANPAPQGALVVPSVVLAAFLVAIPVLRMVSGSVAATNAENFVAFGFVFWLLLDLMQGAYN